MRGRFRVVPMVAADSSERPVRENRSSALGICLAADSALSRTFLVRLASLD